MGTRIMASDSNIKLISSHRKSLDRLITAIALSSSTNLKHYSQPQAQNTPQQPFGAPVNYPFFGVQPPTQQNTSQQSHLTAGPPPTAQNAQHPGNFNRNKRGQNKPNWPNRNQNQNQNQRNNNNNQSSGHFGNQQSSSQGNNQERAFVPHVSSCLI